MNRLRITLGIIIILLVLFIIGYFIFTAKGVGI